MEQNTKQMTVQELTATTLSHLKSKEYSENYTKRIECIYRQLVSFCQTNGEEYFTYDIGQSYVAEHYAIPKGKMPDRQNVIPRALDILSDFAEFGAIIIKRKNERYFPLQFEVQFNSYLEKMRENFMMENTIKTHKRTLHHLADFLAERGVATISDINMEYLNSYIKLSFCHFSKEIVSHELRVMRGILEYLYNIGDISENLGLRLPKVKVQNAPNHLPSSFTTDEVDTMLKMVDTSSPSGKRDYAVLLLASKLGLRTSDIRNLKYDNIDWANNLISITQVKTGEMLVLPLLPDVGWAIIDYIKHGRPKSDAPEIFLRAVVPYISLQNFDNILIKHMRSAGISTDRVKHHGLHSLRHGFATTLLEQETPIHVIQEMLGHINAETTKRYTAVDIKQLRACALEVPTL